MNATTYIGNDRVRNNTSDKFNKTIDEKTQAIIRQFSTKDSADIQARINQLDKEWDIERTLELNASVIALSGVILAATVNKKWLILSGVVTSFLAQHAIQGWCPPLPLFRKMGIRTQKEIDAEKYALQEILDKRKKNS